MPDITPDGAVAAQCVTVSTLISTRPCLLHGLIVTVSAASSYCDVYEGQDADSGRWLFRVKPSATVTKPVILPSPIYCSRGLYVDLGGTVTQATVLYVPLPLSGQ